MCILHCPKGSPSYPCLPRRGASAWPIANPCSDHEASDMEYTGIVVWPMSGPTAMPRMCCTERCLRRHPRYQWPRSTSGQQGLGLRFCKYSITNPLCLRTKRNRRGRSTPGTSRVGLARRASLHSSQPRTGPRDIALPAKTPWWHWGECRRMVRCQWEGRHYHGCFGSPEAIVSCPARRNSR